MQLCRLEWDSMGSVLPSTNDGRLGARSSLVADQLRRVLSRGRTAWESRSALSDMLSPTNAFNLTRWFAALSFITITAVSVALALLFSHFLTREILDRDAILTAQFIHALAGTEGEHSGLGSNVGLGEVLDGRFDPARVNLSAEDLDHLRGEFFDHVSNLPDVLLANVFSVDRRILWSSNPVLIGRQIGTNAELDEALRSRVVVARGHTDGSHDREEQAFLGEPEEFFVENYIPLYGPKGEVVSVVEVYKEPKSLIQSIRKGHLLVWTSTVIGAFVCYLVLFWIVRRASALIDHQQQRIVESETLVVIGEMSSAVAHSIRNPLASIRSSAELGLEGDAESVRKNLRDVISQADRIGGWIRDLLVFSRPLASETEPVTLDRVVRESVASFETQAERLKIDLDTSGLGTNLPLVHGNLSLIAQVINSVVSNAVEAMAGGGRLRLTTETVPGGLILLVADSGSGMSPRQLEQVFKPFYTTKRHGLGLGLALVKRIMERFGGAVTITSREREGTEVRLRFKLAQ
jgi:nitrogen-specific signal transduction histidine kinase